MSADPFFLRVPKQNTEGRAEACGSCDTAGGHIPHARSCDVGPDGSRFDGRMGLPGVWCQKGLANQSSLLPVRLQERRVRVHCGVAASCFAVCGAAGLCPESGWQYLRHGQRNVADTAPL